MEYIKKLEDNIQEWLKPIPHLPTEWRKWLSQNVWWITLVGVILSVFAVWGIYQASVYVNTYTSFLSAAGITNTVGWTIPMMVSIALFALTAVIMAMAVGPLKEMKAKGWDLLFLSTLVSIAGSVFNYGSGSLVTSIIGAVIGAIISMYFLFEVRSYFKVKKEKA
jgi:hypothetical protein